MIRRFFGVMAAVGCGVLLLPAADAMAQAKGSADAGAAKRANPNWKAPRNAFGQPDLEGIWTTDDMRGVPMSRPAQFGTRAFMSDEEFANRAKQRENARAIDDARTGTFRNEEGSRNFGYTSLLIEPADGRFPALTADARSRPAPRGTGGLGPFNTIDDFSLWDRCITRGVAGSWLPVVYDNGTRIIQTPDSVILAHEMVHEARVIPLDGRPHLPSGIPQWDGSSRGHWEGDTLVVETKGFSAKSDMMGSSTGLHLVERFTRIAPDVLQYDVTMSDASTWTAPWTVRIPMKQIDEPLIEYACHEGNLGMLGILAGARKQEADAARAKH